MIGDRALVVLAEDDDALRSFLADVLRQDGYDVIEAANGRELFWLVETQERHHPVDVVITDLRMPSYSGLDVVEAWAAVGSAERVILISAFPDPEVQRRAESVGATLLPKPFRVERLRQLVSDLAQRRERGSADGRP